MDWKVKVDWDNPTEEFSALFVIVFLVGCLLYTIYGVIKTIFEYF